MESSGPPRKALILTLLTLSFWVGTIIPSTSWAQNIGLLTEPYLGVALGHRSRGQEAGHNFSHDGNISGVTLGLRVAATFTSAFAGLDVARNIWDLELDTVPEVEYDYNSTEWSLIGGIDLPPFVRAWAGLIFHFDPKGKNGASFEDEGEGFKLGAAYTGLPLVSFNAEYKYVSFDETTSGGVTRELADDNSLKVFLISASVPWSIEF